MATYHLLRRAEYFESVQLNGTYTELLKGSLNSQNFDANVGCISIVKVTGSTHEDVTDQHPGAQIDVTYKISTNLGGSLHPDTFTQTTTAIDTSSVGIFLAEYSTNYTIGGVGVSSSFAHANFTDNCRRYIAVHDVNHEPYYNHSQLANQLSNQNPSLTVDSVYYLGTIGNAGHQNSMPVEIWIINYVGGFKLTYHFYQWNVGHSGYFNTRSLISIDLSGGQYGYGPHWVIPNTPFVNEVTNHGILRYSGIPSETTFISPVVTVSGDPYVFSQHGRMKLPDCEATYRFLETSDFELDVDVTQMTAKEKQRCLSFEPEAEVEGYFAGTYTLTDKKTGATLKYNRDGSLECKDRGAFPVIEINDTHQIDECPHQGKSLFLEQSMDFPQSGRLSFRQHDHPQILTSVVFKSKAGAPPFKGLMCGAKGDAQSYCLSHNALLTNSRVGVRVTELWRDFGSAKVQVNVF